MNNAHALECIGLEKIYRHKIALRDIHLKLPSGTILALVGPNGAGKTTLLKILATLIIPTRGNATVCGWDLAADPLQVRRLTGFVSSEDRSFYWRLTGRQNLEFFAGLHGLGRRESMERIDTLLEAVGLEAGGNTPFREYSTGMRQSLAIARGLLHDPPVLLLDEPTRSLSPAAAKKARKLIADQAEKKRKIVLIASHNLREVEELSHRIAIIHKGTIRAVGTLAELHRLAGVFQPSEIDAVFDYYTRGER